MINDVTCVYGAAGIPDAFSLCHNLVSLLEGPVPTALGHLSLLHSLLQFLRHGLTLLPQHLNLFIGTLHVQSGCVLFLFAQHKI